MSDAASDAELFRAVSKGSEEAMAALYKRYGGLIYRFSLRVSQDVSIAEEVTQDVFLALMQRSGRFDPARGELSTWLCGMARRMVWKQLERRNRDLPIGDFEEDEAESPDDNPGLALSRKEAVAAVQQGLAALPLQFKEVIVLCEFEEMTYEDVSLILGVPVGTVRSRLHRAKARLARLLKPAAANSTT